MTNFMKLKLHGKQQMVICYDEAVPVEEGKVKHMAGAEADEGNAVGNENDEEDEESMLD